MKNWERPFRPADLSETPLESFDLEALIAGMRAESPYEESGRAGVTLVHDSHITVLLEAMKAGAELKEHSAPSSAMVTLISGEATFLTNGGEKRADLKPGSMVAFAGGVKHALLAVSDCSALIVIGGRKA